MEYPHDIWLLIREYSQSSECYKVGKRVLTILEREHPLGPIRKSLRNAVRTHYKTFEPLFLQLEKSYAEFSIALDFYNTLSESEQNMEYYHREYTRKRQDFIFVEYDLLNLLYIVAD
jgi:hypothetical protein